MTKRYKIRADLLIFRRGELVLFCGFSLVRCWFFFPDEVVMNFKNLPAFFRPKGRLFYKDKSAMALILLGAMRKKIIHNTTT